MFSLTHLGKSVNVLDQLIEHGVNVFHLEN